MPTADVYEIFNVFGWKSSSLTVPRSQRSFLVFPLVTEADWLEQSSCKAKSTGSNFHRSRYSVIEITTDIIDFRRRRENSANPWASLRGAPSSTPPPSNESGL